VTWYTFAPQAAVDDAGNISRNTAVQIYSLTDSDYAEPLAIRDPTDGSAIGEVSISALGVSQRFQAEVPFVMGKGDTGPAVFLQSADGILEQVQLAAQAAASSASSANDAASRSFRLGRPDATAPTWWGQFTADNAPTALEGARAGDMGLLLP
jgi:hypothetical protein